MNRTIGGYVAGNLVISLICGFGRRMLYALGVPYPLALGVFMAIFDLIPLVGASIGSRRGRVRFTSSTCAPA